MGTHLSKTCLLFVLMALLAACSTESPEEEVIPDPIDVAATHEPPPPPPAATENSQEPEPEQTGPTEPVAEGETPPVIFAPEEGEAPAPDMPNGETETEPVPPGSGAPRAAHGGKTRESALEGVSLDGVEDALEVYFHDNPPEAMASASWSPGQAGTRLRGACHAEETRRIESLDLAIGVVSCVPRANSAGEWPEARAALAGDPFALFSAQWCEGAGPSFRCRSIPAWFPREGTKQPLLLFLPGSHGKLTELRLPDGTRIDATMGK